MDDYVDIKCVELCVNRKFIVDCNFETLSIHLLLYLCSSVVFMVSGCLIVDDRTVHF